MNEVPKCNLKFNRFAPGSLRFFISHSNTQGEVVMKTKPLKSEYLGALLMTVMLFFGARMVIVTFEFGELLGKSVYWLFLIFFLFLFLIAWVGCMQDIVTSEIRVGTHYLSFRRSILGFSRFSQFYNSTLQLVRRHENSDFSGPAWHLSLEVVSPYGKRLVMMQGDGSDEPFFTELLEHLGKLTTWRTRVNSKHEKRPRLESTGG